MLVDGVKTVPLGRTSLWFLRTPHSIHPPVYAMVENQTVVADFRRLFRTTALRGVGPGFEWGKKNRASLLFQQEKRRRSAAHH